MWWRSQLWNLIRHWFDTDPAAILMLLAVGLVIGWLLSRFFV